MDIVIGTALPWVLNVIQTYQKNQGGFFNKYPKGLTLNFNAIGGAVQDNPYVLDSHPGFLINSKTGEVTLS